MLGMFWNFVRWEEGIELHCEFRTVDHLVFGGTWMDGYAMELNDGSCRIEALILKFTTFCPIQGVGKFRSEIWRIKEIRTTTNFFIRSKGNPNFTVFKIGIFL